MTRYIPLNERTRPYRIARLASGWVVWDRRRYIGAWVPGDLICWGHPTHAAAVAGLVAHLREQAVTEPSA